MNFEIRPFHLSDLPHLYRICLKTADDGDDATHLHHDPDLLGHMFAAPYALFEPDLCFVLTADEMPVGYCLGTRDSAEFHKITESDWFPELRKRYPLDSPSDHLTENDQRVINWIHEGIAPEDNLVDYPAHLHIDILPIGQKQGYGRKLMQSLIDALRAKDVKGVHLGVSVTNLNAVAFYRHFGFKAVDQYPNAGIYGLQLNS